MKGISKMSITTKVMSRTEWNQFLQFVEDVYRYGGRAKRWAANDHGNEGSENKKIRTTENNKCYYCHQATEQGATLHC